jgi:hypothetical protein
LDGSRKGKNPSLSEGDTPFEPPGPCVICGAPPGPFPEDQFIVGNPQEFRVCWRCFEDLERILFPRVFRRADEWTPQYPRMIIVRGDGG